MMLTFGQYGRSASLPRDVDRRPGRAGLVASRWPSSLPGPLLARRLPSGASTVAVPRL